MPKAYSFRHKLVMEIAGIDPAIFNKIVADGFYSCAPEANIGKARPFSESDVIGVCILQHLLERGIKARYAGELACEILRHHRDNPTADRIVRLFGQVGRRTLTGEKADQVRASTAALPGVGKVVSDVTINISYFREIIAERVAEDNRTLGDED